MDLLEQYKTDHPEAFAQKPRATISTDQPLLVRLVMQWSGGMVRDARQAQYVLLGVASVAVLAALILFYDFFRGPRPPSPDEIVPIAGPAAEMRR